MHSNKTNKFFSHRPRTMTGHTSHVKRSNSDSHIPSKECEDKSGDIVGICELKVGQFKIIIIFCFDGWNVTVCTSSSIMIEKKHRAKFKQGESFMVCFSDVGDIGISLDFPLFSYHGSKCRRLADAQQRIIEKLMSFRRKLTTLTMRKFIKILTYTNKILT